ncbi:glycoside hydrolase family 16 protein [Pseudonocardia sp. HH130630-07]|uniref:glycoside hydrolase family 16 protein n=1 Tax=Pseudonocardia sp. HH130630-07 TaxID=1690815 RepID=UPI0012EA4741|nr:glycoside hydrolase family 16 protein [Pseudonocardia sp. HH130630-07]
MLPLLTVTALAAGPTTTAATAATGPTAATDITGPAAAGPPATGPAAAVPGTAGPAAAPGTAVPGTAVPGAAGPGTAAPGAPAPGPTCTTTAADTLGWGEPTRRSEFDGTAVPPDWHPYGPEPGHDKQGTRTPDQVSVADGAMTIAAEADGTTGAASWHPGQRYGRWEACVRSEEASGGLNALLLLWPVAEDFPVGGEIDWMEITDDSRQETSFFLHYGEDNDQDYGSVRHDSTQWSAYALEWTPEKITAYVNGEQWYSTTNTEQFPPGPMNMTMQLDYFGDAGGPTAMHLDWARQWALPQSEPATLSLPSGAAATGQPKDHPERAPRELTPEEQQAQDALPTG